MNDSLTNQNLDELRQLQHEGSHALAMLFSKYRERLERIVRFRMDTRLTGRIDPDDILQEAYLDIDRRLSGYLENPAVPVFVCMRQLTLQTLIDNQGRHLRRVCRLTIRLATSKSSARLAAAAWVSSTRRCNTRCNDWSH